MRISASLWSVPVDEQPARLDSAVSAGLSVVHWDHADGGFATKGGFSSQEAYGLVQSGPLFESEAHLMVSDPLAIIDAWAEFCSLIVIPLEIADPWTAVRRIESRGSRPALAVSLETDLLAVPRNNLPILVMAITPGRAGAPFTDTAVGRIRLLTEQGCHELVGVDGGVGPAQFSALRGAGATWLVSGGSLFAADDLGAWLTECRRQLGAGEATSG